MHPANGWVQSLNGMSTFSLVIGEMTFHPFLLVGFLSLTLATIQQNQDSHTVVELREDLTQLWSELRQTHPGVDRHVSLARFDATYQQLSERITAPLSDWEFFRMAAELRETIRCGHTRVAGSPEMDTEFRNKGRFFSLAVKFVDRKLYARLPGQEVGEIQSINGITTDDLRKRIFKCVVVDGGAEESKYEVVAENFAVYYAQFIDLQPFDFEVVLSRSTGSTQTIHVKPIERSKLESIRFDQNKMEDVLFFKVMDNVAYLRIASFHGPDFDPHTDYPTFLHATFRRLATSKVSRLIIDIRGNGGGDDYYGALLYSYLTEGSFRYFKTVKTRQGNEFVSVAHRCLEPQPRSENAFPGKVCLLVDGRTFSTAADVASVFRSYHRGTIVGRETRGGYLGNTSGASRTVTLKNTGIRLTIPLWYYENAVTIPDPGHRGVMPDRTVPLTKDSGADPELQAALEILK